MKQSKTIRNKRLSVCISEGEKEKLKEFLDKTTCRALSEYARTVLLKKPVHIFYRNKSADDFLNEMIQLKNELNAIGYNFNQVFHKLHTLDHYQQIKDWIILNETHQKLYFKKVDEIKEKLSEIYQLWLQK